MSQKIKKKANKIAYQKRIEEINKDRNQRTVWESIDRPIRPLIFEFNRIGLRTKFSCCGFPYEGEEEPKSHHASLSYVFVYNPLNKFKFGDKIKIMVDEITVINFFSAVEMAQRCGWEVKYFNTNIWHFFLRNTLPDLYNKNDDINRAIHDYESQVLGIHNLTRELKNLPSIGDEVIIVDGNKVYEDAGINEWQVKAKRNYIKSLKE